MNDNIVTIPRRLENLQQSTQTMTGLFQPRLYVFDSYSNLDIQTITNSYKEQNLLVKTIYENEIPTARQTLVIESYKSGF